ncbi:glycosyltransferase family 2 protein [Arthrobacter oryzae]|uniref:glycosyltransferase family 2 protein n=1 Tax=Arthrobacter oryzae TaxID=409290 RepID=UPI0030C9ADEA
MNLPISQPTQYFDATDLEVAPAMDSNCPPDWAGARWIGSIDASSLTEHSRLKLLVFDGYERARLLVREGTSVRGFIDVVAPGGLVDTSVLEAVVSALPAAVSSASSASTPFITVVVCTRDRASHLRGSLAAILRLDYPSFDVLVIDNAAKTTETEDVVRAEFGDPRVRLIAEPVPGLSRARNTGLRHARGEIVAFTDDDTVVDPAWLREIAAGFDRASDVACVTGLVPGGELRSRFQGFFEDRVSWSRVVEPKIFTLAEPPADLPTFPFCVGEFGTGANFALNRRIALSMGAFDTAFGVGTRTGGAEDLDMFTRVILDGYSLVVQPSAIVWHRHRDDLDTLRLQARGYGTALGAWITKVLLNPRTARLALARSPRALRILFGKAARPSGSSVLPQERDPQIAEVLRIEMASVARGPLKYFLQRLSGEGVIR